MLFKILPIIKNFCKFSSIFSELKISWIRKFSKKIDKSLKIPPSIRKVVYEWIETQVDKSEFQAAKALDDALWQQSILNRIEGRKKNNQKSIIDSSKNEKIKSNEKKENNFQYLIDPEIMIKNLKNIIKEDR